MMSLLDRLELDPEQRVAFALPPGATWALPLYELALMSAVELRNRAATGTRLTVVTPEREPLWLFGPAAGEALRRLLAERGVALLTNARAVAVEDGALRMHDDSRLEFDHVVALPAFDGPEIAGLPHDRHGFLPTDAHGRVAGAPDVYAAGDATTFPLKQGGLAAQQADAAAETIAAAFGLRARPPEPFRPVLRGLLLTAGAPLYLRAEVGATGLPTPQRPPVARPVDAPASDASTHALWWPPGKIAGRYLAPLLATARPAALTSEPLVDRVPGVAGVRLAAGRDRSSRRDGLPACDHVRRGRRAGGARGPPRRPRGGLREARRVRDPAHGRVDDALVRDRGHDRPRRLGDGHRRSPPDGS